MHMEAEKIRPAKPAPLLIPASSSESDVENEEVVVQEQPPSTWTAPTASRKRLLSKQLSMRETTREAKWEKRRRQILQRRRMMTAKARGREGESLDPDGEEEALLADEDAAAAAAPRMSAVTYEEARRRRTWRVRSLTDEDLDELRGSIELGFGFNEEDGGQDLCHTLPALDLYFAVNRQLSDPKLRFSPSPASTPTATSSASTLCGTPSPRSPNQNIHTDSWKICNPGDNPQHVKTRLRHWAQAVACSVRQCC